MKLVLHAQLDPAAAPTHPLGDYCASVVTGQGDELAHVHLPANRVLKLLGAGATTETGLESALEPLVDELTQARSIARERIRSVSREQEDQTDLIDRIDALPDVPSETAP